MNVQDKEAREFLYKVCIETRNFEIAQLVARNNFFMIFQGVLFAGLAQASGTAPAVVVFVVCAVGVIASLLQACMASGAKFWQERWEYELEKTERELLVALRSESGRTVKLRRLFSLPPKRAERIVRARLARQNYVSQLLIRRFSVSRLPIYAGYSFLVFWILLLFSAIQGPWGSLIPSLIIGFPSK